MHGKYFLLIVFLIGAQAQAQDSRRDHEDYAAWELLKPEFGSTGGGGVIIRGYAPIVSGSVCTTDFTATDADGKVFENSVVFEALPVQGGILCQAGKWRAKDGSATGTTPFRVFIKDGVSRRSP